MYCFIGKLHHSASFIEYLLRDKPCTGAWEVWNQRQNPSQLLTRNATELARVAPQPNLSGRGPSSWRRSQRSLPNRSGYFEGVSRERRWGRCAFLPEPVVCKVWGRGFPRGDAVDNLCGLSHVLKGVRYPCA